MMKFSVLFALVCVSSAFPEFTVDVLRKELSGFKRGNGESNVVELAQKLKLNTLVELITKAGLTVTLSGPGPFTIFGPTDEAFAKLPKEVMESLEKDVKFLTDVLLYHVLGTKIYSNQLTNEQLAPSLLTSAIVRINIYGELYPDSCLEVRGERSEPKFLIGLRKLRQRRDLRGIFTLVTATGSQISKPDNNATNGVIHVLDRVMYPIPMNDIPTSVALDDNFSTLVNAIEVAGLADALTGGPYTFFAPTNEAFEKLPPGVLEKLLEDKEELIKVLAYHLVEGPLFSAAWKHGDTVTTVENDDVIIGISSNRLSVNNANVIYADAAATNGVVHVIDSVLLPPAMEMFQLVMS